ncbi:unnamed protein product [Closterium sp. NIES-53]
MHAPRTLPRARPICCPARVSKCPQAAAVTAALQRSTLHAACPAARSAACPARCAARAALPCPAELRPTAAMLPPCPAARAAACPACCAARATLPCRMRCSLPCTLRCVRRPALPCRAAARCCPAAARSLPCSAPPVSCPRCPHALHSAALPRTPLLPCFSRPSAALPCALAPCCHCCSRHCHYSTFCHSAAILAATTAIATVAAALAATAATATATAALAATAATATAAVALAATAATATAATALADTVAAAFLATAAQLVPPPFCYCCLLAAPAQAETSAHDIAACCGTPRTSFFEGCAPSLLAPSVASAAAIDFLGAEVVGAASAATGRRNKGGRQKGKGGGGGSGVGGGRGGGGRGSGGGGGGGGEDGWGGGGGGSTGGGGGSSGGGRGGGSGGGSQGATSGRTAGGGGGSGGGQQQLRRKETLSLQLRECLVQRGGPEGDGRCTYVRRSGSRAGDVCGRSDHAKARYFCRLEDAFCEDSGGVVPASVGACDTASPSAVPAEALLTFTLDSGASRCFFCDCTTVTPLTTPVLVTLADPSSGPIVARCTIVLPCPAVPSGSLTGFHLPSFSTNLVSNSVLQDHLVTTTTLGGKLVAICMDSVTGDHLATFTRRPGSGLYTLHVDSAHFAASGQVAASCSCRLLTQPSHLWHHHLGHSSLQRLHCMHSHLLVSSLPRSLPTLPPSLAPPCTPCVERRRRAVPHSSSSPPTTAPLQTLHMDVWGPAPVPGSGRERYFMLVVDDHTSYTTVFPLRRKGDARLVLIPWIRAVCCQLSARFHQDLP